MYSNEIKMLCNHVLYINVDWENCEIFRDIFVCVFSNPILFSRSKNVLSKACRFINVQVASECMDKEEAVTKIVLSWINNPVNVPGSVSSGGGIRISGVSPLWPVTLPYLVLFCLSGLCTELAL